MKKRNTFLILIFAALICLAVYLSTIVKPAKKTPQTVKPFKDLSLQYGLIKENAMLLNDSFVAVSSLPSSYFVIIEEENTSYYKVKYLDLNGFIEKPFIEIVDYEPKTKYASAYFTANNDTHPVNIRSLPNASAPIIAYVPDKEKAFLYGSVTGERLIPAAGDKWYYVRINNGINRYGYVYSAQGTADAIAPNVIEKIAPAPQENNQNSPLNPDKNNFEWVYVLLLCIPAIIIMFALFSKPKNNQDNDSDF